MIIILRRWLRLCFSRALTQFCFNQPSLVSSFLDVFYIRTLYVFYRYILYTWYRYHRHPLKVSFQFQALVFSGLSFLSHILGFFLHFTDADERSAQLDLLTTVIPTHLRSSDVIIRHCFGQLLLLSAILNKRYAENKAVYFLVT